MAGDQFDPIREALEGPFVSTRWQYAGCNTVESDDAERYEIAHPEPSDGTARFIGACDPYTIRCLLAERDALQAKVEAMEKDAGRWQTMRLLIRQSNTIGEYGLDYARREPVPNGLGTYVWKDDASIDAAIDAARSALAQPTGEKP